MVPGEAGFRLGTCRGIALRVNAQSSYGKEAELAPPLFLLVFESGCVLPMSERRFLDRSLHGNGWFR